MHLVRVDENEILGEQFHPRALRLHRDAPGQHHEQFHALVPVHLHAPDLLEQEFDRQFFVIPNDFIGEHGQKPPVLT